MTTLEVIALVALLVNVTLLIGGLIKGYTAIMIKIATLEQKLDAVEKHVAYINDEVTKLHEMVLHLKD